MKTAVTIRLDEELEHRLHEIARQHSLSMVELVERILAKYLDAMNEDGAGWVRITQEHLQNVWSSEDFSNWQPPHAS